MCVTSNEQIVNSRNKNSNAVETHWKKVSMFVHIDNRYFNF